MKREYLTRAHVLDAIPDRTDTVVAGFDMILQALPAYTQPKHGFAVLEDGKIYAIFGLVPLWPGVAETWMIPTKRLKAKKFSASRHMKEGLDQLIDELKVRRAQAAVKVGHTEAHRLVQFVGMQEEGLMKKYGPDGSDFVRYARW